MQTYIYVELQNESMHRFSYLFGHECVDCVDDEADDSWGNGEGDGVHHAIDVHGWLVNGPTHCERHGAGQQHLGTWITINTTSL